MRSEVLCTALLSALVAGGGGCQSPPAQALPAALAGNDPEAQIDFWHALPERHAASNDEAFHAMLLFADGQDAAGDYPGRVALLKKRRMLPADFDERADEAVRRGTLAVVLVRVLEIKGGATMHVVGAQPRYAVRELMFDGLYPPSSPQQTFSGAELLGIIGRAEDYQRTMAGQAPETLPEAVRNASR
jgi:hypothetical protein